MALQRMPHDAFVSANTKSPVECLYRTRCIERDFLPSPLSGYPHPEIDSQIRRQSIPACVNYIQLSRRLVH